MATPPESPERHADAVTANNDREGRGRNSPPGEENLSAARDNGGGRGGEEDGQGPSGATATKPRADEEGTLEPNSPLCEATNTSNKAPPRSKIPTVRRTTRRTRGAL